MAVGSGIAGASKAGVKAAEEDKRLAEVTREETADLNALDSTYNGIINSTDKYYNDQIQASKDYAAEQERLQNEQTDFTIDKIEQQRANAEKDYKKEQSGAYVDWQKQSNQYGANAEKMASMGMAGTGFSESSQVSMYNTWQNRVATAREAFIRANENFDIGIREAQLQNSVALAEIRAKAHQQQLELSLQGFQQKNTLLLELADKKRQVKQDSWTRYQTILEQIQDQKQFDAQMEEEQRQFNILHGDGGVVKGGSSGGISSKVKSVASKVGKAVTQSVKNAGSKATNTAKGKKQYPIDMASVKALGFSSLTGDQLDFLVQTGKVFSYVENGKLKFKLNTHKNAATHFLSKTFKNFGLK